MLLVKLMKGSWYGDFQILLNSNCDLQLEATKQHVSKEHAQNKSKYHQQPHQNKKQVKNENMVQIFELKGQKLLSICDEYPEYRSFLLNRAT